MVYNKRITEHTYFKIIQNFYKIDGKSINDTAKIIDRTAEGTSKILNLLINEKLIQFVYEQDKRKKIVLVTSKGLKASTDLCMFLQTLNDTENKD